MGCCGEKKGTRNRSVKKDTGLFGSTNSYGEYMPVERRNEVFYSELEEYCRYLELYIQFGWWDVLTPEEAQKYEEDRNKGGYGVTTAFGYKKTAYTIPDCRYNCGCAPCGCDGSYSLFSRLKSKFDSFKEGDILISVFCTKYPKVDIQSLIDYCYKLEKEIEKNGCSKGVYRFRSLSNILDQLDENKKYRKATKKASIPTLGGETSHIYEGCEVQHEKTKKQQNDRFEYYNDLSKNSVANFPLFPPMSYWIKCGIVVLVLFLLFKLFI